MYGLCFSQNKINKQTKTSKQRNKQPNKQTNNQAKKQTTKQKPQHNTTQLNAKLVTFDPTTSTEQLHHLCEVIDGMKRIFQAPFTTLCWPVLEEHIQSAITFSMLAY